MGNKIIIYSQLPITYYQLQVTHSPIFFEIQINFFFLFLRI